MPNAAAAANRAATAIRASATAATAMAAATISCAATRKDFRDQVRLTPDATSRSVTHPVRKLDPA